MAEHTFLQPLLILVLGMVMLWLHVLGSPLRLIFFSFRRCVFNECVVSLVIFVHYLPQDLEFVQFHPTGIYGAGCLITEGWAFYFPLFPCHVPLIPYSPCVVI